MASHPPPFQVEDNTDEAFFDELVNDDYPVSYKAPVAPESTGDSLTDGNESDDAKAISSLSIHDDVQKGEGHWEPHEHNGEAHWKNQHIGDHNGHSDEVHGDHHHTGSINHDRVDDLTANLETVEHINHVGNELESAKLSSGSLALSEGSCGTGIPEVKVVEWSAFHTASARNDGNGFGSYSDFFNELEAGEDGDAFGKMAWNTSSHGPVSGYDNLDQLNTLQYSGEYNNGHDAEQSSYTYDLNDIRYWESLYPGWKYDPITQQWYHIDGYDAETSVQAKVDFNRSTGAEAHGQGVSECVTDWNQACQVSDATETTANWNQHSQASNDGVPLDWVQGFHDNNGYPPHMVFDPQYPGWYYDTISMEWCMLETYGASVHSNAQIHGQMDQGTWQSYGASTQSTPQVQGHMNQGNLEPFSASAQSIPRVQGQMNQGILEPYSVSSQSTAPVQGQMNQGGHDLNQIGFASNYHQQQNSAMQLAQTVGSVDVTKLHSEDIQNPNLYGQNVSVGTPVNQQKFVSASAPGSQQNSVHYGVKGLYDGSLSQDQNKFSMPSMFDVGGNLIRDFNDSKINQNDLTNFSNDYYGNQRSINFSEQQVQNAQISYAPVSGRSSAGRPAHALVAFAFGGKLVVMKDNNFTEHLNFGSQNHTGGSISVLNLLEVVNSNIDTSGHGMGSGSYFQALSQQSIPGPLTGGSFGKELNKWIDERITNLDSTNMGYGKADVLSLLLSLLKISCQYYGKLRSPYGTDIELKESDTPELAIARLFASAKRNSSQFTQYDAVAQCLQQIPSEAQVRVTATEVQNLLVSGRKKEALHCAQEGQLWGPALVLAAQLSDQFYVETVKKMALRHLAAGSPLRTLCLLIASQPADVFSGDNTTISNMPGALNVPQQPAQMGANGMLDDWEENLAVITANRTKDDELVLLHLGDCLWQDRNNIIAAHICYLVADANFESYSDSARLCLVGADHLKFPRTYACPQAIQRTEIYEYSKTIGNSQFVLLPFQPYKFVYALMLAEVGRMSEAIKYCQAVSKSLKTGRTPEVETLRHLVSSLEERIKAHQQGGFSANLAPKEFIGKLLKVFDSTAHRVVGGLPPSVPVTGGTLHGNKDHHQSGPRVSTSQSTMAMSSLMPSQSMEPISELAADSNRTVKHARSVSEPDFGRSPVKGQADSLKEASSPGAQDKASAEGTTSTLGRLGLGTKLFQKTLGFVLKNRREAKLGETNKFYYDEKLKRWVEEGAEPPAEEAALPPPPTTVFQNGASDYNLKNALQNEASFSNLNSEPKPTALDSNSGMPPLPPTTNQYSARARMGVRSRYVDTFNKGGGNVTSALQSPIVPPIKPSIGSNPKFFVPAPVSSVENPVDTSVNTTWNNTSLTSENLSTSPLNGSLKLPASPSSTTIQRFPSMNSIPMKGKDENGSFPTHSRRTASWSGSFNESFGTPSHMTEVKPLGEVLGMHPLSTPPSDPSVVCSSTSGGSVEDDLQDVKL